MFPNRHGNANSKGNPFMEAIDKLKDDYNMMQQQLNAQRMELEKINGEKEAMQRHYMMYYEMSCTLNLEMQKQQEIAKRYQTILQSILPFCPGDQQATAIQAMDRANKISVQELQQLANASQAQQLGMMMGGQGALGAMNPFGMNALGGGLNMAAALAAVGQMRPPGMDGGDRPGQPSSRQSSSRQRSGSPGGTAEKMEDDADDLEIDVQNDDPAGPTTTNGKSGGGRDSVHSSGASTPAQKSSMSNMGNPLRNPLAAMDPQIQARLAMQCIPNGKPAYSFRVEGPVGLGSGHPVMTQFPPDALTDPEVPKKVKVAYDLPHGEVVCAVAISRDSSKVYTGGKGCVKIWDISGTPTPPLTEKAKLGCLEDNYIRSCRLYSDGTRIVVGGEASNILVFDVENQKEIGRLDTGAQACYALSLNQETRQLYACCADGHVVIFDLNSMTRVYSLPGHNDGASCVDLSPDGLRLWTGGLDSTLRSWDLRERRELTSMDFTSQIFSLGCSPVDDWVAVGMENNNVEVVNTATRLERYQLHRHDSCVLSLKYSHSGKWFCTTGKDNILNTWRAPYGALAVRAQESSSVLSCDISQDDQFIVTGSGEKKATVYQVQYDASS